MNSMKKSNDKQGWNLESEPDYGATCMSLEAVGRPSRAVKDVALLQEDPCGSPT